MTFVQALEPDQLCQMSAGGHWCIYSFKRLGSGANLHRLQRMEHSFKFLPTGRRLRVNVSRKVRIRRRKHRVDMESHVRTSKAVLKLAAAWPLSPHPGSSHESPIAEPFAAASQRGRPFMLLHLRWHGGCACTIGLPSPSSRLTSAPPKTPSKLPRDPPEANTGNHSPWDRAACSSGDPLWMYGERGWMKVFIGQC